MKKTTMILCLLLTTIIILVGKVVYAQSLNTENEIEYLIFRKYRNVITEKSFCYILNDSLYNIIMSDTSNKYTKLIMAFGYISALTVSENSYQKLSEFFKTQRFETSFDSLMNQKNRNILDVLIVRQDSVKFLQKIDINKDLILLEKIFAQTFSETDLKWLIKFLKKD